jgi:hypothetical protein
MLLTATPEETYCLKTQMHVPVKQGRNIICYRCGMWLSVADEPELGTLLDY